MYKISVEKPTLPELAVALIELGQQLGASQATLVVHVPEQPVEYTPPTADELKEISRSLDVGALKQLWDLLGAEHQTAAVVAAQELDRRSQELMAVHQFLEVRTTAEALAKIGALANPPKRTRAKPSASEQTPESSQASSSPAESEPPAAPPAEQPQAPAADGAPASDSQPVVTLEEVRAILSRQITAGKKDAVNALVTSYAPALSKVPAEKLAELAEKAEAL